MEDTPKLLRIPMSECPDLWTRLQRHKWPISWSNMEDSVVLLERNLYGHPLGGFFRERQFVTVLLGLRWEKAPNWECQFVHRKQSLFLSVYVDDMNIAGRKQNLSLICKKLMKLVDLG